MTIAGLSAAGMTRNQALAMLQEVYAQPITVYYEDRPILLVPEMVELMLDVPATTANLEQVLLAQEGPRGFIEYAIQALGRREMPSQDIRPVLTYSRERIDAFLRRTAQQFDHPPLDPVPLPEADTFRPAQHGTALDVEASLAPLIAALLSPTNREVHLVVRTEPPAPPPWRCCAMPSTPSWNRSPASPASSSRTWTPGRSCVTTATLLSQGSACSKSPSSSSAIGSWTLPPTRRRCP
ncbi:MAG TPA: hypothetical protein PLD43_09790 [Anaerolineae bacterium]|nr:hypothetical protein [Anaerolineae bacterium]